MSAMPRRPRWRGACMIKPLHKTDIVLCLPGNPVDGIWAMNAMIIRDQLLAKGLGVDCKQAYFGDVCQVYNLCLRALPPVDDIDQEVLGGTVYEWIVIIDSDNYPTSQQILKLIAQDREIIAGWYALPHPDPALNEDRDALKTSVGMWANRDLYQFKPFHVGEMRDKTEPFAIDTTGLGTLVVKRGVFEMLRYPWFEPVVVNHEHKAWFAGIDIVWSRKVQDVGFKIYVDPTVRVPHKKKVLL